ncbi:MAG: gamma-glutamyltransferase [Acidobacteriota bacterium]|jgi:gamma-glutamyltranspeptidase/glutathione hydrolase
MKSTDFIQRTQEGFAADPWREGTRFRPGKFAASTQGMVATAHHRATDAGVDMLRRGGNAVDAAVAAAFALGVCEPAASGLGGQTMMMVHLAAEGRTLALDGSSRAPNRAFPGRVKRAERLRGYRATTVPSTPATLAYAIEHYGRLDLATILKPAIRLAEKGFEVTPLLHALMVRERRHLRSGGAGAFFLRDGRRAYPAGGVLRQPVLGGTLRRIARLGVKTFYRGKVARQIHEDMIRGGGLIRRDDLAQVPWPIERRPLVGRFDRHRVLTFPPPGAGRTLVEMMNIVARFAPDRWRLGTPETSVLLAALIQKAFQDRRDLPYHPDLYRQAGQRVMLSEEHARRAARELRRRLRRGGDTTHLSVMDREGNAVALTQSIERVFGAFRVTPELGFLYNNYMSAFEYEDIGHPYHLRPNAVPWASVAPTLIFRGRRPWLAIGSPGSDRITPAILQVLLRLQRGENLFEAVDAPRLHCTMDGVVHLEAARMRDDIPPALEAAGFEVNNRDPYSFYLGCVQVVERSERGFLGVADPRRDGSAAGPAA